VVAAYDPVVTAPDPSTPLRGAGVLRDPLVAELLAKRLVATLATIDAEGMPHVVPMWFAVDGDAIVLATSSTSRKLRNLARDPRATFTIHDSRPGLEVCGATIIGQIEAVSGTDAAPLVRLVHRRYVSAEGLALPEPAVFLASDDIALRLTPLRASTWDQRGTVAAAVLKRAGEALPLETTDPRP
jgi:PPOX class probable F420-dependent enzyme